MNISKSTLKKLLLLALATGLILTIILYFNKHEPEDKDAFYMISGTSPEDAQIFVNGNPTNRGQALSLFLIEGRNTIDHRSSFENEGYDMRVIKTKNLFSSDFETILNIKKNMANAKKSSTSSFKIGHWWRWTWQDCDTLTELTDSDKEEILKLFDSMCELANNFEEDKGFLTSHPDILPWSEHTFFTERAERFTKKIMTNLPPRSELVETKASHENIKMLIGKQIIMLISTDSEKLYDLSRKIQNTEPDANGVTWNYGLGYNEMFIVKKDAKWKMILPTN